MTDLQKRKREIFVKQELERIEQEKKHNENLKRKRFIKILFSDEVRFSWVKDGSSQKIWIKKSCDPYYSFHTK